MKKLKRIKHPLNFSARPKRRHRPWRRAMLLTLTLPPLLAALFAFTLAYRIYASNRALAEHFPAMAAPHPRQSLLVFAPHCDDETLGVGGLMERARHNGCEVHVVIITNGDGFRIGVSRDFHKITVMPTDYIRYAYERQEETRTALGVLSVPRDHITFLGYPDQGLMHLWLEHWSPSDPYKSYYTQADHCPYNNAPTPDAPYCGQAVLDDIKRQMLADKPTDIFVTHPSDDHPDHSAAGVFVAVALAQLKAAGIPWAQTAHLHYYLVHRGDWPVPQGLHENERLTPPAQLANLDTQWETFPLTLREIHAKYAAIKRYKSQTEIMDRFLYAFARQNELFGTLVSADAPLAHVPDGHIQMDGHLEDWIGLRPVDRDPTGDSVMRALQASADITQMFACRDSRFLYVRIDARHRLSSRVAYTLALRPLVPGAVQAAPVMLTVKPRGDEGRSYPLPDGKGASYAWHGSHLEVAVPLAPLGLDHALPHESLYLDAETRFADVPIDKTGFRCVSCAPVAARTASLQ